jgi:hypothetical protein
VEAYARPVVPIHDGLGERQRQRIAFIRRPLPALGHVFLALQLDALLIIVGVSGRA